MNINEVLYLPVKREGLNIGPDKFFCKHRYRTLDGDEVASSFKAKTKKELLDQQKPEIPRFVANWIEDQKQSFDDSSAIDMYENLTLDNHGGYYHDVWLWAIDHHNDFVFAWTYGYTVKKEKLYTVEIPNPNALDTEVFVLAKNSFEQIVMTKKFGSDWKKGVVHQLTKKEIRKDFDWAWQFREEVAE
ncbi:DUF1642 domain-containing protein [Streptococcus agalactiae]|uniref:DUF1642 domain-containing protein n=1 Tax=Streptococcus agalactiae TaxID=1311 RepID=UPI0013FD4DF4|nr:DUF1642 domain-containing protein [Streptococcus agalactiae]